MKRTAKQLFALHFAKRFAPRKFKLPPIDCAEVRDNRPSPVIALIIAGALIVLTVLAILAKCKL